MCRTARTAAALTALLALTGLSACSPDQPAGPAPAASRATKTPIPAITDPYDGRVSDIPPVGMYEVGTEVQPGWYSSPSVHDRTCKWWRLSGPDWVKDVIEENDMLADQLAPESIVKIEPTDKYFRTDLCAKGWKKVG